MKANEQLKLEGALNIRDIGGYLNNDNEAVKQQSFIRAANCSRLTENDCHYLYDYGLRSIIDLRSDFERNEAPDQWLGKSEIKQYAISLSSKLSPVNLSGSKNSLATMYIDLIDNEQVQILKVMEILASNDGATLYHCSAGKDRTGVITMLLLKLAKVDLETILTDYEVSEVYLQPLFIEMKKFFQTKGVVISEHMLQSKRADMEAACTHFDSKYEIEAYLKMIGLSEDLLLKLKGKLV